MSSFDHRLADALAALDALVNHEVNSVGISAGQVDGLTLEAIQAVAEVLGSPQDSFPVIHVTGTNGKGTVCRMAESLLLATGLRVGTYLSPEGTVAERIRIDGQPIDGESLADALTTVRGAAEAAQHQLTTFEAVTLTALVAFADAPVDVAVIEVGLLGRYDATNVVHADVAVITTIGGDHTDFTPGWQERVMAEKAGIIESGGVVVLGDIDPALHVHVEPERPAEVLRFGHEFDCTANEMALGGRHVELVTSRGARHDVTVAAFGSHQGANAAVALEAVEALLHTSLGDEVVEAGFDAVRVPGRVELVANAPLVVLDGAHNADAAAAVGDALADSFAVAGRRIAVVGVLSGRHPRKLLEALHEAYPLDLVVAVGMEPPRGEPASVVEAAALALDLPVVSSAGLESGIRRALDHADEDDLVLITGSFRLIDPARAIVARVLGEPS